jgi:predicted tellurium resistance membrane protein TerC
MDAITLTNIFDFLALSSLEIILGIDNVIFISLLVQPLPKKQKQWVRFTGIGLALVFRVILLALAKQISYLNEPMFYIGGLPIAANMILFFAGGVFLTFKGFSELYKLFQEKYRGENEAEGGQAKLSSSTSAAITQIIFIDLVLSFDSVFTAVAMRADFFIIVLAITLAIIFMLVLSGVTIEIIQKYPTIKVLAIAFIILVGVYLTLHSFGITLSKNYLYAVMGFSSIVEIININLYNLNRVQT